MGIVVAVSKSIQRKFGKDNQVSIKLVQGLGIEEDCHSGTTNQHLYAMRKNPEQPNLRQVHLMHTELFTELKQEGFDVAAGQMGENITTEGIDILNLPLNTVLKIGKEAQIQITGLREPCSKIDTIQKGLMKAVLAKDEQGNIIRKSGIMSIVIKSGEVKSGDSIEIILPQKPYIKLDIV